MNKISFELFIKINDKEIVIYATELGDIKEFKVLEKIIIPIDSIKKNILFNFNEISSLIKKKIFLIEKKVNFIFKEIIIILDNFEIFFLNLTGFKKLNGTQISKENITYILNSLKSSVEEIENKKKILHIFNSKYCLDKKKLDNLPVGLFGDFYYHELSFHLINQNDFKNIQNIFENCNLKIKKVLVESFVKGSFLSNLYPTIDTFLYIKINSHDTKIVFSENDSIKFEQKFKFGSNIVTKDISKTTSLKLDTIKKILEDKNLYNCSGNDILEEKYFIDEPFRKIKKQLLIQIAEARIKELSEIIYLKNVNFNKILNTGQLKVILLELDDQNHIDTLASSYSKIISFDNKFEIKLLNKISSENMLDTATKITQFGWKKEAIPISMAKKSLITRIFQLIFK